jgi:hypothetical protein
LVPDQQEVTMRKATIILAAVLTFAAPVAGAQEKGATPQDVVRKVKQAANPQSRNIIGTDGVVR